MPAAGTTLPHPARRGAGLRWRPAARSRHCRRAMEPRSPRATRSTAPRPPMPVPRSDVERGFRALNILIADLRDDPHRLAAQVVTLTEEVARRIEAMGPAEGPGLEGGRRRHPGHLRQDPGRHRARQLDEPPAPARPRRQVRPGPGRRAAVRRAAADLPGPLLPPGVPAVDPGSRRGRHPLGLRPPVHDPAARQRRLLRVHNDPTGHGCTAYTQRPSVCRRYDCRDDARIWEDYEQRIPRRCRRRRR